jgi:hypothetical protein
VVLLPRLHGRHRWPAARAGLLQRRQAFDAGLAGRRWGARRPGERVVSLFCYDNPALPGLLQALADDPHAAAADAGPRAATRCERTRGVRCPCPGSTRGLRPPAVVCDLNFVRGEDSLVRALWAGVPFVWQAYPQHDGAHFAKLDALLLAPHGRRAWPEVAALWHAWNGWDAGLRWPGLPALGWARPCRLARTDCWRRTTSAQLLRFAREIPAAC